jgi:hypothetical protein
MSLPKKNQSAKLKMSTDFTVDTRRPARAVRRGLS